MAVQKISIDRMIEIVSNGGIIKTGIDIYNEQGLLLLEKDVLINKVSPLLLVKSSGINEVPIIPENAGGVWDSDGRQIQIAPKPASVPKRKSQPGVSDVETKVRQIEELKKEATVKYGKAKETFKKSLEEIKEADGEFDVNQLRETVNELFDFLTVHESAFSYLTKEILSYDEYLYNHSINVCTIGTAILNKFNEHFSTAINDYLSHSPNSMIQKETSRSASYINYLPQDRRDASLGFFLHDVGKVLIPEKILNKPGRLNDKEFAIIKTHSYEKGLEILERNHISNPFAMNTAQYHHSALYNGEDRCYPEDKIPLEVPLYVKICKLADIYDAMTSKRAYKDAMNPTGVVANIFHQYADKDRILQFILHSFVKAVGIYPPGSVIFLRNGQMAYVIDSKGPMVVPFTDPQGNTLKRKMDPMDIASIKADDDNLSIDRRKPLKSPIDVYDKLPAHLKVPPS